MIRILARKLLDFETDDLWLNLKGDFILLFDDGEIITNAKMTIYSHYAWVFHKQYPKTPMLKKHHVQTVLGNKRLAASTHIELISSVLWDSFEAYPELDKVKLVDNLAIMAYKTTNKIYNDLTHKAEDFVVSLDAIDFLNILENPQVKETLSNLEPDHQSIDKAYSVLQTALKVDKDCELNPLSRGVRAKLIKEAQVLQCLGPRGYITDIDSNVFPKPVMRGYFQGFRLFHDSLVESRSAAKALYFSKKDLQDAEYFSRRLQLLSQTVKNLHHGDCGSTNYLNWHVRPAMFENGEKIYDGDLKYMVGKYYKDPHTGKLKAIKETDKHLENTTIQIRSVVAGCNHPDPYGVCSTCFGELAVMVPENTNIGQLCATSLTQKSSQAILSTKHLDSNSSVEAIGLNPDDKKYLKVASSGNSYMLSDSLKGKQIKLCVSSSEASGLTDIASVSDVHRLAMTRVSEITTIALIVKHKDVEIDVPIVVSRGKRLASLTYSALEFIKKKGWLIDDKENFIIDLDGWNFNDSLLTLPVRHFNMSDVTQAIAATLESNMTVIKSTDDRKDPEAVLVELFDLVVKHLSINLCVLEVTLLGAMVISNDNRDFRIPKGFTTREMGAAKQTIPNRSMGGAMAYEYHRDTLQDPASFIKTNRPDHQFDVMLCPQEVIESMDKT
jgi:hypothetical protein